MADGDPAAERVVDSAESSPAVRVRIPRAIPRILSIAGTDPTGGAGIQADLKSIAANGGYGMAVVTALVAQNTRGVRSIHVPPVEFLREQLDAVSDDVEIDAVKIGMLPSMDAAEVVAEWLSGLRAARPESLAPIIVLDPVMVATSGHRLAAADGIRMLLPFVDLVTPNLLELGVLVDESPAGDWSTALGQAHRLSQSSGIIVLAKGGHLAGAHTPDALVDAAGTLSGTLFGTLAGADSGTFSGRAGSERGRSGASPGVGSVFEIAGERIDSRNTHGTGCSLSSAIATRQAQLLDWPRALAVAKSWLEDSIRSSDDLHVGGGNGPINHFTTLWRGRN